MLNILTFNIYHCLQAARHAGNPFFSLLRLENGMRMMSAAQKCLSQAAPANIPGNIGEALAIRMNKLSSISAEVRMIFNRSCMCILMYSSLQVTALIRSHSQEDDGYSEEGVDPVQLLEELTAAEGSIHAVAWDEVFTEEFD